MVDGVCGSLCCRAGGGGVVVEGLRDLNVWGWRTPVLSPAPRFEQFLCCQRHRDGWKFRQLQRDDSSWDVAEDSFLWGLWVP